MKENRAYYFDYLRVIAIIGVLVIHVAAAYVVMYTNIPALQWQASVVANGFVRWCVPIFFMISGALLLGRKEEPLAQFFKRRANRIIVPFVVWSIVYYVWRQYFWYDGTLSVTEGISLFAKNGIYYHLWYLYALIGIYLVLPMLNIFVRHAQLSHVAYICAIWFIVYCGFRYFSYEALNVAADFFVLSNYMGMVLIGYWLSRVELSKRVRLLLYAAGIGGIVVTIQQTFAMTAAQGAFTSYAMQYESPFVMLSAMALFIFFRYVIGQKQAQQPQFQPSRFILAVSQYSFGIYLCHVLLLDVVRTYFHEGTTLYVQPLLGMPLQLIVVFGGAFALSWLLQKLPIVRKIS